MFVFKMKRYFVWYHFGEADCCCSSYGHNTTW